MTEKAIHLFLRLKFHSDLDKVICDWKLGLRQESIREMIARDLQAFCIDDLIHKIDNLLKSCHK